MKIVIFGSNGFLGTKSMEILSKNHEVIGVGRSNSGEFKIDATNKEEVREFLLKHRPDLVFDTIALTSSTQCENNPQLAEDLNYLTAKNISEACREINSWIVFMSSTYIFDGEKGDYNEEDKTFPTNEYARTKIMAEKEIIKNPKGIILRIDALYGYNGENKKNGVFDQILSGNAINLREPNQIRQPIFVDDIPKIMIELINKNKKGIYHLAGPDRIKMIDFLKKLESIVRKDSRVGLSNDLIPGKIIKVPFNATLNTSKVMQLGVKFTSLEDGLSIIKNQLN